MSINGLMMFRCCNLELDDADIRSLHMQNPEWLERARHLSPIDNVRKAEYPHMLVTGHLEKR